MLVVLLFGTMLSIMFMRVWVPIGAQVTGKLIREVRLSLWERLAFQRTNLYAIAFVLVLSVLTGAFGGIWEILVMGGVLAILTVPIRYVITTEGIAINNVVFRPWSDFTGVDARRRRIRLVPCKGMRPFDVRILQRNQAEVLEILAGRINPATPKPATTPRRRRGASQRRRNASGSAEI